MAGKIIPNPYLTFKLKQWLGYQYDVQQISNNDWEINTPFLDYINDNLRFFVTKNGLKYEFTDDGWFFNEQEMMNIKNPSYQPFFKHYGIEIINEDEICISCRYEELMETCLKMIQAMISLNATLEIKWRNK